MPCLEKSMLPPPPRSDVPSLVRTFEAPGGAPITSIAFRPYCALDRYDDDNVSLSTSGTRQFATAAQDGTILLWSLRAGIRPLRFIGHKGSVNCVDFTPCGRAFASAGQDCSVRVWAPTVKGDVTTFKAHAGAVRRVSYSSDGKTQLTCSDDKSIKLWSATHTGKFICSLVAHTNWVRAAVFAPSGNAPASLLASGGDDRVVRLWDARAARTPIASFDDIGSAVLDIAFEPGSCGGCGDGGGGAGGSGGGSQLAVAADGGQLRVYDVRMRRVVQVYYDAGAVSVELGCVSSISHHTRRNGTSGSGPIPGFSKRRTLLVAASPNEQIIKIYDLESSHLAYTLHGHDAAPTCAAFSRPECALLATGAANGQVFLWSGNYSMAARDETTMIEEAAANAAATATSSTTTTTTTTTTARYVCENDKETDVITVGASLMPVGSATKQLEAKFAIDEQMSINQPHKQQQRLANALEAIVAQLDVLTTTMNIMERRLTSCEDRLSAVSFYDSGTNEAEANHHLREGDKLMDAGDRAKYSGFPRKSATQRP